jgi:hypothetical protein
LGAPSKRVFAASSPQQKSPFFAVQNYEHHEKCKTTNTTRNAMLATKIVKLKKKPDIAAKVFLTVPLLSSVDLGVR